MHVSRPACTNVDLKQSVKVNVFKIVGASRLCLLNAFAGQHLEVEDYYSLVP